MTTLGERLADISKRDLALPAKGSPHPGGINDYPDDFANKAMIPEEAGKCSGSGNDAEVGAQVSVPRT